MKKLFYSLLLVVVSCASFAQGTDGITFNLKGYTMIDNAAWQKYIDSIKAQTIQSIQAVRSQNALDLFYMKSQADSQVTLLKTSFAKQLSVALDTLRRQIGDSLKNIRSITFALDALAGKVDGKNKVFTLSASVFVKAPTIYQFPAGKVLLAGTDYKIAGNSITMTTAPPVGSVLVADFAK